MILRITTVAATLALAVSATAPTRAAAQVEIEADPIAYALNGYSLHLARVLGSARVNLGTFGIDVPTFYHGNEGWTSRVRGAGVKLDYLGASVDGFFVGLDGGYMRIRYAFGEVGESVERDVVGLGVRGGYRLPLGGRGFYLVPWMSIGYNFDGDDVVIAGEEFRRSSIGVFPTVHLGWRF